MHVSHLRLYQFRNFSDEKISFSPQINFIVGANGQGKTNLVEAFNVLSLGRSFRTSSLRDLVQWGHKEASIFAKVEQGTDDFELGVAIEGGERTAYINGSPAVSLTDYVGRLLCVSFSPDDLELVKGGPGERRRFLDRHLHDLQPRALQDMLQYQRAIRHKTQLLKSGETRLEQYEAWNKLIAESGVRIVCEREKLVVGLNQTAREIYSSFAPQDGALELRLQASLGESRSSPEAAFQFLMDHLPKEIARQRTTYGPHRDDLVISLGDKAARSFASQGQTRSIVLALKLAVIALLEDQRGESPVVLLDDVDSELDRRRGDAFFELVLDQQRQILITGTEIRAAVSARRERFELLEIHGGQIGPRASTDESALNMIEAL